MRKSINANIVAANAFLTTGEKILSKEEVVEYVNKVRKKTNYKTDSFVGGFEVNSFARYFDFIFGESRNKRDLYVLSDMDNIRILKGYFRRRMPKYFIKIMEETGKEYKQELLKKEIEDKPKVLVKER